MWGHGDLFLLPGRRGPTHTPTRKRDTRMRVARLILVAALVAGIGVVTPAIGAAPVTAAVAAEDPDFTPSPNKWRSFMLNILGSVLGGAMPNSWRAEQIANQFRYNHAWDDFYRLTGWTPNIRDGAGELMPIPSPGDGTYSDFVIAEYEKQFKKGGTGGKPFAPPSIKPMSLLKFAGGALTVYGAFEVGNFMGAAGTNLVGGWFGFDAQGAVCGQTTDGTILSGALRYLSGQECNMWNFAEGYELNGDAGVTYGPLEYGGRSISFVGTVTYMGANYHCYSITGGTSGWNVAPNSFYNAAKTANYGSTLAPNYFGSVPPYCPSGSNREIPQSSQGVSPKLWVLAPGTLEEVATMEESYGDPERRLGCTVTYTDASTTTTYGAPYRESGASMVPPICAGTPSGKTPESIAITEEQLGGGPTTEVATEDVTDEYQEWWDDYPECRGGACKLDLIRVSPSPAVSCFDLEDGCIDWHTDPAKESTYLCRYGVHDVALSECNVYAGLFQPGRVTTGSPYADPTTGTWSGGKNAPSQRNADMARVLQDPTNLRSCDFEDVGFDPVGWILRGGQCLVEWTLVARPAVVDATFATGNELWESKPPAVIAAAVSEMTLPTASGCSISIDFLGYSGTVLDACSGPMAFLASVSRIVTGAVMVVLVFGIVRRQIAGMVGYNVGQS